MEHLAEEIVKGDFGTPEVVKEFLARELKLEILHTVADGVLAAKTNEGTEELVVRVVDCEYVSKREITEWPRLKHANVVRLLNVQYMPVLDAFAFITVNHPFLLISVIGNDHFFIKPNKIVYIRKWLREILSGLQYLHEKGKCHLGLCLKNVFISSEFSAIIKAPSERCNVPVSYSAPESKMLAGNVPLDDSSFDLWCFGILSLRAFTRNDSENINKLWEEPTCWWNDIYGGLYSLLQKETFVQLVKFSFPKSKINTETLKSMRNLITSCLRLHPEDRPSARQLMNHKYLAETGCLATSDELWENKVDMHHQKETRMRQFKKWFSNKFKKTSSKLKTCFSFS